MKLGPYDRRLRARCDDEVHLQFNELGSKLGKPISLPFRPSPLHDKILAFRIAEFAQPFEKWPHDRQAIGRRLEREHTKPPDFPRRCSKRERPHEHAEGDEQENADGSIPHARPLIF